MNMTTDSSHALLCSGLKHLDILTPPDAFMSYLLLLQKWNKAYNLTAIRDLDSMVTRHILDSLTIKTWVTGRRILDVGSGAGLPGIPLALTMPDTHFILADSNGKKTRFMQEAKRVLQLHNVEVIHTRIEDYHPEAGFDTILTRAFSDLSKMLSLTQHLLNPTGQWLAMKGLYPDEELRQIEYSYQVERYRVFGMEEDERCCVKIFCTP